MCQLLGVNCSILNNSFINLFSLFRERGGNTDIHSHGWGLAIYEGRKGLRTFFDAAPAAISPLADVFLSQYSTNMKAYNIMAHIRYATQGEVSLENVHPFTRELWGNQWTFCHNGEVPKFSTPTDHHPTLGRTMTKHYNAKGDTDSEAVFCAILNALRSEFRELPALPILHIFLKKLCDEIIINDNEDIIFNFLLGCGQYTLFAYSWPGSRPGSKVWNGLHYIIRQEQHSSDLELDRIAVITTKPLTNENGWKEFQRGELILFDKGRPYSYPDTAAFVEKDSYPDTAAFVEKEGRGLYSKSFSKMPAMLLAKQ